MGSRILRADEVATLQAQARKWGGDIIQLDSQQFSWLSKLPEVKACPFNMNVCLNWESKQIMYVPQAPEFVLRTSWPALVHEMAHVFTAKVRIGAEGHIDEWDFFGWELSLVKHLGLSVEDWKKSNKDFGCEYLGQYKDFGDYSEKEQDLILLGRVRAAKKLGLVSRLGVPQSVRLAEEMTNKREKE